MISQKALDKKPEIERREGAQKEMQRKLARMRTNALREREGLIALDICPDCGADLQLKKRGVWGFRKRSSSGPGDGL